MGGDAVYGRVGAVCDKIAAERGAEAVTVRAVRAALGGGSVKSIHDGMASWREARAADQAPRTGRGGAAMAAVMEFAAEFERLRDRAERDAARAAASDAEVSSLLGQMDVYAQENDVLRGRLARLEAMSRRLHAYFLDHLPRGEAPGMAKPGKPGVAVLQEAKGLARWDGEGLLAEAVGEAAAYVCGVQIRAADLAAPGFMLPVVAVELARVAPPGAVRVSLVPDPAAATGYCVAALSVDQRALGDALNTVVLLAEQGDGELSFDGAAGRFAEWLDKNGLDAEAMRDFDVRVAIGVF